MALQPPLPMGMEFSSTRDGKIRIEHYLISGWELFKQNIPGFVGFCLLGLLLWYLSIILVSIFLIQFTEYFVGYSFIKLFPLHPLSLIYLYVMSVIASIVILPFFSGLLIVGVKLLQRQPTRVGDYFAGFRYFLPLLGFLVVGALIIKLGVIVLIIPGIYFLVSYTFVPLVIIDRKLNFWQSMQYSRKTVRERWFGVFGLVLVLGLINFWGAMLLIGSLVTVPWTLLTLTVAYADLFGLRSIS